MENGIAPVRYSRRVVRTIAAWSLVVCTLGIPVAPQKMKPPYSVVALTRDSFLPLTMSLATGLASTSSIPNPISLNAAVLFVFFSSEESSLYARGETRFSDITKSGLGESLTRPATLDAMLASTSLVPEAPAWEPIFPNASYSRLTLFPDWRKRTPRRVTDRFWTRVALPSHDSFYLDSPALITW
jgi:hypothetical protein